METKGNVEKTGAICRIYRCDISKRDQVAKLGAEVREDFGVLDILVNNAGIVHVKNFLRLTDSEICQTIEVNLFGTIWVSEVITFNFLAVRALDDVYGFLIRW